ncbi:MAG: histidine--tRNA ligase [Flavobacteriales bacterium]|nr:histidine--tRNA ligase [Flavobacteriales bacterium]MDW8410192.1 histidine--tRNA ligase [Flavobacteriales bacterium]
MSKPALVKGTRDFGPEEFIRRRWIIENIRSVYELYGFLPMETPAMEMLTTLSDTYGEEGDKLIFRILNSGNFMEQVPYPSSHSGSWEGDGLGSLAMARFLSEKALRYDLTVPLARFVSMRAGELTFPFKRYQIQPVWRADRPQKGRYREFYQCDADVVGSDSVLYEAEFLLIFQEVLDRLGLSEDVLIRVNHRALLQELCLWAGGETASFSTFCILWDKADKLPQEKLLEEFVEHGFRAEYIRTMFTWQQELLKPEQSFEKAISIVREHFREQGLLSHGAEALAEMWRYGPASRSSFGRAPIVLDLSLARGLTYYTGAIFEVTPKDGSGSLAGGGRYDNLTGRFGKPGLSGVGISFGADRIYDYLLSKGHTFADTRAPAAALLLASLEGVEVRRLASLAYALRHNYGVSTEVYPTTARLKKQIEYAVRKKIPFVGIFGPEEAEQGVITLKNLQNGQQDSLSIEAAAHRIKESL